VRPTGRGRGVISPSMCAMEWLWNRYPVYIYRYNNGSGTQNLTDFIALVADWLVVLLQPASVE